MASQIRVILITGFLGSGKTTLLNRLVAEAPKSQKMVIMINEFGEVGVDGVLLEGTDLDVMEISKGSIFCACVKTDFIRGLNELATSLNPDLLVIEATGAANPEGLKRDLNLPIFKGRFDLAEQICLVDALNFAEQFEIFTSLEKQIASSTAFLINKIDKAGPESVLEVRNLIQKHHPAPKIFETEYAKIDPTIFFSEESTPQTDEGPGEKPATPEELEAFIDQLLESPSEDMCPPDVLISAVYEWNGTSIDDFRAIFESLPGSIVRAKGLVNFNSGIYLFSLTMGHWELSPMNIEKRTTGVLNRLVFIATPETMNHVEDWVRANPALTRYFSPNQ